MQFNLWIHQAHIPSLFMASKSVAFAFDAVVWSSKTSTVPFSWLRKVQISDPDLNSCIGTSEEMMCTWFVPFQSRKTLFLPCFQLFDHCWLQLLLTLTLLSAKTNTVPCLFIYGMRKRHYYLSVSTLISKNISGTLFVVCLCLSMLFVPFSCILTCKYINHTYPVAVYTLNTGSGCRCGVSLSCVVVGVCSFMISLRTTT